MTRIDPSAFEELPSNLYLKLTPEQIKLHNEAIASYTLLTALEEAQNQTEEERRTIAHLKRRLDIVMKDPEIRQYMLEYCEDNQGPDPRLWVPKHMGINPIWPKIN